MAAFNRREFLKKTGASAAAAAAFGAYPGAAFSQVIGTSTPFPDYKALALALEAQWIVGDATRVPPRAVSCGER